MSPRPDSAGIAGLCFLGCALCVALAFLSTLFRVYAPAVRDWLLWLMVPQFGLGILFAFGLTTVFLLVLAFKRH